MLQDDTTVLVQQGRFLLDRLSELDFSLSMDDFARDHSGHVDPAIERFRATLERMETTLESFPADGATGAIRAAVIEECAAELERRAEAALVEKVSEEPRDASTEIFVNGWRRGAYNALHCAANAIRTLTPTENGEQGK